MKNTAPGILRRGFGLCLLLVSYLAFAQSPSPAPHAPPTVAPGADPAPPPTPEQSSYLFGLSFGAQLRNIGITNQLTMDALTRGVKEGLQGKQPTAAEMQQLQEFVHTVMLNGVAANQAAAKDFLTRNGHEKGVITTASGLQYKVITAGSGKAPPIKSTDTVTVEYRGKLIDGSEFDSSFSRGVPASFPVNGVIKGWQEALVLMKPGAKYQLFIPPALAYGDNPRPKIPGGSLLIFEVNVVSAEPTAPTPPAAPAAPQKPPPK